MGAAVAAMAQLQPAGATLDALGGAGGLATPAPFLLKGTLREYQHIGLDWLVTLYHKRLNGGLGGGRWADGLLFVCRVCVRATRSGYVCSGADVLCVCLLPFAWSPAGILADEVRWGSLACAAICMMVARRCLSLLPLFHRWCILNTLLTHPLCLSHDTCCCRWGWARLSRQLPCWRIWPVKSEEAAVGGTILRRQYSGGGCAS